MSKEFTKKQKRLIKQLITKMCANYFNENCCLLDVGDGCPCIQIISYHLMCNYFKNAVLPLNPSLEKELLGYNRKELCALCKKPFVKTGNNQRYCIKCSKIRRNTKNTEYVNQHRNRKKM